MIKETTTKKTNLIYTCTNQENCKIFEIYEAKTNKTEKRNSQNYLVKTSTSPSQQYRKYLKKKSARFRRMQK